MMTFQLSASSPFLSPRFLAHVIATAMEKPRGLLPSWMRGAVAEGLGWRAPRAWLGPGSYRQECERQPKSPSKTEADLRLGGQVQPSMWNSIWNTEQLHMFSQPRKHARPLNAKFVMISRDQKEPAVTLPLKGKQVEIQNGGLSDSYNSRGPLRSGRGPSRGSRGLQPRGDWTITLCLLSEPHRRRQPPLVGSANHLAATLRSHNQDRKCQPSKTSRNTSGINQNQ
ncbi:hypothetical protein B0T14DRAFT_58600 [Immersiella caudata]|uniref:Uncharacterized protein n=1 Tax=Immersiella caudata TaxID=314043 RepID=A0AA39XFU7_9PEZI|nr:hypothetical protein B0T14DRAFT_58600 [Immersiella caudata]